MPTIEEHEILLTRWVEELWNRKNYAVAQKLVHSDFVDHGDGSQDKPGVENVTETIKAWHTGFPDGRMTLESIFSEGDRAVVRMTFRGTHSGSFRDVVPSGKSVIVSSTGIARITEGKIVESWGDMNILSAMRQIGGIS